MRKIPLEEALTREEYLQTNFKIPIILGYDDDGKLLVDDLMRMPHILIGGVTGSGKSAFIQNMITCLTSRLSPDEAQLMLFDLKKVEFQYAKDIPHLHGNVITDVDTAVEKLQELVGIMNDRSEAMDRVGIIPSLSRKGMRGIDEYNAKTNSKLPLIVAVFDEYAELIMQSDEVQELILKLAAKGHGAGIHLIIASQRTTDEIFSSNLRAVVHTRAAFRCASDEDSWTMLGSLGAENLLYHFGEMMYSTIWMGGEPIKVKVPYISEKLLLQLCTQGK
jgi:S-DNA-T family DNA segregation ATPase FtsK/SpoIIIE